MRLFRASLLLLAGLAGCDPGGLPRIQPNDNLVAAGRLRDSTLSLTIEARMARWFPDEERRDSALVVAAFGTRGKAPSIPGPLIRVRSGTRVKVRIVNHLDSLPLFVHGLHSHPAAADDTVQVAAGGIARRRVPARAIRGPTSTGRPRPGRPSSNDCAATASCRER